MMEGSVAVATPATGRAVSVDALTWTVTAMALGATSIVAGVIWDISWHSTIGRDTFWTPAHIAIYLGGVVAGFCGGWLALKTTFAGSDRRRSEAVGLWGFRAPLGAWVAIWGAIAMLTSAPFDDWWHNAYGLDVEILSPPHTVLALGILGVALGALLLALAAQNRARSRSAPLADHPDSGHGYSFAFVYVSGLLLAFVALMLTEYRWTNEQRTATFYLVTAIAYPIFLVACARASGLRWAATSIAGVYMLVNLAMIWILPLFAAEPLLAPIYNPVTSMVTDVWPLVLVVPGLAIDLVRQRWRGNDWALALVLAALFVGTVLLTQWNFSRFLLSPAAENFFFAGDRHWSYTASVGPWTKEHWGDPVTAGGLGLALVAAFVSTRLGLWWGSWMRRVKR